MKVPARISSSVLTRSFPLLALLSGCGLPFDDPDVQNSNACSSSSECGPEGTCITAGSGESLCIATEADLGSVILDVRPTGSDASFVFFDAVNVVGRSENGLLQDLELSLPPTVAVTGSIAAPKGLASECTAADHTLPVAVTMIRQVDFSPFASRFELPSTVKNAATKTAAFNIGVPPGTYDLYLQPQGLASCVEELPPPELVKGLVIEEGKPFRFTQDSMSTAATLSGTLTVPLTSGLEGWVLEVLEPTYGYVVSTQFLLTDPAPGVDSLQIKGLTYHDTKNALLRLTNADGNLSVHWALDTLDLNSDDVVELDLRDLVAEPLPFSARIRDSGGAFVPSASVSIQSIVLTGSTNQNANYHVDTRADETGTISVKLVPGTYSVTIIPDILGDATYFGEWEITGDQEPFGKTFDLVVQPVLKGLVTDPKGQAMTSAPINVGPSQSLASDYFTRALIDPEPLKRQFVSATNQDGNFELSVDPGEVDVAVQMGAGSGYPWSILPSFKVGESELKSVVDIGEMQLRYPVLLQGQVTASETAIPFAQVRAWVRGKSENGNGPLIQIGAAVTDADGIYMLPLPPRITSFSSKTAEP